MTEPARLPRPRTARAAERAAFRAWRAGEYNSAALADAMAERLAGEPGVARVFAASNTKRWVPIGPSVILRGGPVGTFPRATGRVRDLRVSADGRRAYAATAKGGLWHTDDGGALWAPVGGWADRPGSVGGTSNAQSCGCLDVVFGATAADDFVMVGTGELQGFGRPPFRPSHGGVGVLAARGPAVAAGGGGDPWEPASGLAQLEGLGCFALARDPASTPGTTSGPALDRVLVGTNSGLFLGLRRPAGPPHNGEFAWSALGTFSGLALGVTPIVTDVRWLPAPGNGRVVVALALGLETPTAPGTVGSGVAVSDDLGATYRWVTGLDPKAVGAEPGIGRMSFSMPAPTRLYVLGERHQTVPAAADLPSVWRIDPTAAAPAATLLTGVPDVWTRSKTTGKNQRDYDQAIAVDEAVPGTDRVYLGGNFLERGLVISPTLMPASVWCLDVPIAGTALVPTPGVSRPGSVAAGGDSANPAGLIGDDIHPDVHMIRFAGPAAGRQVWVATDGGVYVSTQAGRVNSFAPRSTGLAAVEVNYVSPHPSSSHYVAAGTQDNGRHVRLGDVVWKDTMGGDGGGVAFHPTAPQVVLSQFTFASWATDPPAGFVRPLTQGGPTPDPKRENDLAAFYSSAAAVARTATAARIAVGTNRVWLTDDLAVNVPCTWQALPFPSGPATNPRPLGTDAPAGQGVGVPGGGGLPAVVGGVGALGAVLTSKWVTPHSLLVVFVNGVVRWTQDPVTGQWSTRVLVAPAGVVLAPAVTGAPDPARTLLSDVAPVPGTDDFYLVTTGVTAAPVIDTCLYFHDASATYFPTNLRGQLLPLDPAYASVVDPASPADVYVGTVTGVWQGTRGAGPPGPGLPWPHTWTPRVNGLPSTLVQDLSVWQDPAGAPGSPRLLRAAMQSRGIWELDLAAAAEPQRTYARVHDFDDRRMLPAPMKSPRVKVTRPDVPAFASPDITVRPRAAAGIAPKWGGVVIPTGGVPNYQLWTFQTAFRWLFPSVTANGEWSAPLAALVALHRGSAAAMAPAVAQINQATWDDVVGNVHATAAGVMTRNAGDPLAVYRAPWQTAVAPDAVATELDLSQHVRYPQVLAGVAQVFAEPSTVDVLIHHRDIRPVTAGNTFAFLFWQSNVSRATLLALDADPLRAYVAAALAGPVPPAPAGWNVVLTAGQPRHGLVVALDARMPRAVPIDLDLSPITAGHHVLLVAVVGSDIDPCGFAPVGLPAAPTALDLARRWPYATARLVHVAARP